MHSQLQDVRQTAEYAAYMRRMGWQVERVVNHKRQVYVYIKKLGILPVTTMKILRHLYWLHVRQVQRLRRKHWSIICKQEPLIIAQAQNTRVYFKVAERNAWPILPTKTLWLDLSLPLKRLYDRLKKRTRQSLDTAKQNKLQVMYVAGNQLTASQFQSFFSVYKQNKPFNFLFRANKKRVKTLIDAFSEQCFLVFVTQSKQTSQEDPLSVCLVLCSQTMACFWYHASTKTGKQLQAPTLCLWSAIQESKKRDLEIFDFEGLWDERFPNKNTGWKGFSLFKEGFVRSI